MNETIVVAAMSGALSGVGGIGLWNFLTKRLEIRSARETREEDRLRADHEKCLERVETLERRLEIVEAHHSSLFARWIKDAGKRLSWVNGRAMATIFGPLGYTRDQVEGRRFQDLLDVEAAREIDLLDEAALAHPGCAVWSMLQLHPRLPLMIVVKVAGIGRDQELIYEGQAYELNDAAAAERGAKREEGQMGLSQLRLSAPEN